MEDSKEFTSALPNHSRLFVSASATQRRILTVLIGSAFAAGLIAMLIDLFQRATPGEIQPLSSRILAAAAMFLAGTAALVGIKERQTRDIQRRARVWRVIAAGFGILYLGQGVGYLLTARTAGAFDVRVEVVPMIIATPLLMIGLLWLGWPPNMGRADRWSVAADTLVAAFILSAVWVLAVTPAHKEANDPNQSIFVDLDPWFQWAAAVIIVAMASASRRSGSLAFPQLALLQSAVLVYLISDILGDSLEFGDRYSGITWSMLGFIATVALFALFTVRPAMEADTDTTRTQREWWSTLVPAIPISLLAVVAAVYRFRFGPIPAGAAVTITVSIVVVVVVDLARRLLLYRLIREQIDDVVSDKLAEGSNQAWFGALLGDSRDVVTVVDRQGRIVYQTPSVTNAFGYQPSELVGVPLHQLSANTNKSNLAQLLLQSAVMESSGEPLDIVILDSHGVPHDTETTIRPMNLGGFDGFVLTTRDVTDRRQLRAALTASGMRDPLTGLNNREGLLSRLQTLHDADGPGHFAVGLIDLCGFRDLNDGHGHEIGDEALRAVAASLNRLPASAVAVGRIGGDEFALVLHSEEPEIDIGLARRQLQDDLRGLALSDDTLVDVNFSLGYAVCEGPDHLSAVELLEQADLALSSARRAGPMGITKYEPGMRDSLTQRLKSERALRSALESDRILVHYQPIVSFANGHITGVEALVRMRDSEGRLVSPALFVPMAESLGLIHQLGQVVLRTALTDLQVIRTALGHGLTVSVNVSAMQLDPGLHPSVSEALQDTGADPQELTLELTETVLAENQEAARNYLAKLRSMGCQVALDDFGTGYSSLAYLASMPVDILKIDRSFVSALGTSDSAMVLVRAVVQLAASLGLTTIAEGVETTVEDDILRELGTDRAQGYLYSRPLPLAELLTLIASTGGRLGNGRSQSQRLNPSSVVDESGAKSGARPVSTER